MALSALPAMGIRGPNLGRASMQAAQVNALTSRTALADAEAERQKQVRALVPGALGGGNALTQLAGVDPKMALAISGERRAQGAASRAETKEGRDAGKADREAFTSGIELVGRLLATVRAAPEDQRPAKYARALQIAQRGGIPLDDAPAEYDPAWVEQEYNLARSLMSNPKALSTIGKIQADVQAGIITPEQAQERVAAMNQGRAVNVTTSMDPGEKEESKGLGKYFAEQFINTQQAGRAARGTIDRLDALNALLGQTYTGAGAEVTMKIKRAAKAVGIDLSKYNVADDVAPAEAAKALSSEMALELRNPAGGAGMPGAMSDKDREFLQSMTPNMGLTPEGRKLLIRTKKKLLRRNIDVARLAREHRNKEKTMDGFDQTLAAWSTQNPLFNEDDFAQAVGLTSAPANLGVPGLGAPTDGKSRFDGVSDADLLKSLGIQGNQ